MFVDTMRTGNDAWGVPAEVSAARSGRSTLVEVCESFLAVGTIEIEDAGAGRGSVFARPLQGPMQLVTIAATSA